MVSPVRASVTALPQPGHAVLLVTGLDATADGLTISLQRQQGPDTHLADDGWRRTETWLMPDRVTRRGDVLEFHLGPEICDRLAGIATVRLRVREPDIGVVGTTVLAWPAMLTSGAADGSSAFGDDVVRLRQPRARPAPEPTPEPEPPPAVQLPSRPAPDLRAARDPMAELQKRSGATGWMIAALVVLALAGGGYYVWTNHINPPPPETVASAPPSAAPPAPPSTVEPPKKSVREVVGEYLATKPAPDALLAKGREFARDGNTAAAFLVFRQAAEQGSAAAQIELASFYDPVGPARSGFPQDGTQAATWYERAALAGVAEAQRKLGLLLAKGGAGLAADMGEAKSWLQKAAAQNDAEAKKALDALPK